MGEASVIGLLMQQERESSIELNQPSRLCPAAFLADRVNPDIFRQVCGPRPHRYDIDIRHPGGESPDPVDGEPEYWILLVGGQIEQEQPLEGWLPTFGWRPVHRQFSHHVASLFGAVSVADSAFKSSTNSSASRSHRYCCTCCVPARPRAWRREGSLRRRRSFDARSTGSPGS